MKRRLYTFFLLTALLLNVVACKRPQEEGSGENSTIEESRQEESVIQESHREESTIEETFHVPENWTQPEILRFCAPEDWLEEKQLDQAVWQLGRDFLESRVQAEEGAEEYGYSIESYDSYKVRETVNTSSLNLHTIKGLRNIQAQEDGRTWIVGYSAMITKSKWVRLPKNGGPDRENPLSKTEGEKEIYEWNLGDWWVLHQEGNVFSMMSYTDYRCVQETSKEYSEDPFAQYPVSSEDIPKAEFWEYSERPYYSDEVQYFQPLQTYLHNSTIVFEYKAETESDAMEDIEKAALELGQMYLEELCSKEYDPNMTGKHIRSLSAYYVKGYKELGLAMLENSTDRTLTRLKERGREMWGLENYEKNIPSDYCIITDMLSLNNMVKAAENIWIAEYKFLVTSDDPVWGAGKEFVDYRESGLPKQRAIIVKQGKEYFMVMSQEIIMESRIRKK